MTRDDIRRLSKASMICSIAGLTIMPIALLKGMPIIVSLLMIFVPHLAMWLLLGGIWLMTDWLSDMVDKYNIQVPFKRMHWRDVVFRDDPPAD